MRLAKSWLVLPNECYLRTLNPSMIILIKIRSAGIVNLKFKVALVQNIVQINTTYK